MKSIIVFNLDGTLAESKQPIDDEMAALLSGLMALVTVVIMSGGDWPQFQRQLLSKLAHDAALDRLIIMPTSGTKMYRYDSECRRCGQRGSAPVPSNDCGGAACVLCPDGLVLHARRAIFVVVRNTR